VSKPASRNLLPRTVPIPGSAVAGLFFIGSPTWNKKIFKFELGEKVRLARKVNLKDADEKSGGAFEKVSMRGAYGKKEFTMRCNKARTVAVQVYSLAEKGDSQHFYKSELVKISPSAL